MGENELAVKLAEIDERCKANTNRIEKLEIEQETLSSIATSVAVLANEQKSMSKKVDSIDEKVDKLESIPANRWNGLVEKIIYAAAGGIITWIISTFLK
jgi:hypothetical protein